MKPGAAWVRQEGESWRDWSARNWAERIAHAAERNASLKPQSPSFQQTIAVGVGTYDGNGNPKGSGWR